MKNVSLILPFQKRRKPNPQKELAFFNSIITISVKIIEKLTINPFSYCTIVIEATLLIEGLHCPAYAEIER